ncbi:hypothetical protein LXA43DRAFT_1016003 [Ganoderma leucocontextum]|nr:hypothetical protein LXA43DRAFT_1016003 [Ganoderma leucocontextum]
MVESKPLSLHWSTCLSSKVYDGFVINSTPCVVKTEDDPTLLRHEHDVWNHLQSRGYEPISQGLVEAEIVPSAWGKSGPTIALVLRKGKFFLLGQSEHTADGLDLVVAVTSYMGYCLINCLKLMPKEGVLHRDIHPGNVMILKDPRQPKPLQPYDPSLPYTALFVDFGHSLFNGKHPTVPVDMPIGNPDYYAHNTGEYSPRDDLEALAYTLLSFRRGIAPPWAREVGWGTNLDIPLDANIPAIRDDMIDGVLEGLECFIREFVCYARSLLPESDIDYDGWSARFWNEFVATYEARPETQALPWTGGNHLLPVELKSKVA